MQCSQTLLLVPKNLVLYTGHAGKLPNHTACRDSEHSQYVFVPSVSGTCKLCLELLSYACLLGSQTCPQLSVFLSTQRKGQGPSTIAHYSVHGAIWPPWSWNWSFRHEGLMYCKGLHLMDSFSSLVVSKMLYHFITSCLKDLELCSGVFSEWYLPFDLDLTHVIFCPVA